MAETYTRRALPPAYDSAWFSVELAAVQRVLAGINAASGVTPGTYGDATHVAQFTVNAAGDVTSVSSVAIIAGSPDDANSILAVRVFRGRN